MWYSHIFGTQYTHHSIISKDHLTECEVCPNSETVYILFFSYFYHLICLSGIYSIFTDCVIVASPLTNSRGVCRVFEMGGGSLYNCRISGLETSVMLATEDDGASTVARNWEVTIN